MLLPLLLAVFFGLSFYAATRESVTIDEFRHLSTGVYYWQTGDFSYDDATPPLWKLICSLPAHLGGAAPVHPAQVTDKLAGWGPWFTATQFMRDNAAQYTGFLTKARVINILAACGCLAYLYRRARRDFGVAAALFGTTFLAFSPTLLAHSHYASTDIIAMLAMTMLVFQCIDLVESPRWWRVAVVSLLLALSLLCKFSAVILLPAFALALFLAAPRLGAALPGKLQQKKSSLAAFVLSLSLAVAVTLLTLNAQYGFRDAGRPLRQLDLQSTALQRLSRTPLGQLPVPLPKGLIQGFDHQKSESEQAEFPSFLLGKWSATGFPYYYAVAFCLKETVPFILMLLLVLVVRRGGGGVAQGGWWQSLLLWYLPACLFIVLSFMNRLDVGVRYLLPAYPFLCYFFGRLYAEKGGRPWVKWSLVSLLVVHCASTLATAPQFTTYFNELSGGPAKGYRYLLDSNIDNGQGLIELGRYLQQRGIGQIQLAYFGHGLPEFYGIHQELLQYPPKPGYAAISVSLLQGHQYLLTYLPQPYIAEFDYFGFMRSHKPVALVGNSIMLYHLE